MKTSHPSTGKNMYEEVGDIRTGRGAASEALSDKDRTPKVLLVGKEGTPGNYRASFSQSMGETASDWTTPRHHHVFEQIRHPLEGDYSIGKDAVLPAGWVAYFPESAFYGPQKMSPNLKMFVLQYGGPSGVGYMSADQRRKGFDELLAKGGKFEEGFYTWTDAEGKRHNQDAHEALWEQVIGKKCEYPEARYDRLILMNPANFNWVKDPDQDGVAYKRLGSFSERDIRIGFVALDKGAKLRFGTEPSSEILFLRNGRIGATGSEYETLTAFGTDADDSPETLTALEESDLFYVKLPTF